jgi:1-acyl-sn-glycerol-3-phosphate acyltransferase
MASEGARIRSELRRAYRVVGFAGITAGLVSAFRARQALAPQEERDEIRERWVHRWATSLLALFRIELTRAGAEAVPGALVVANHRSTIDIGIMLREFGGHIVSREDLAHWPLVGMAARSVGTVFVDRDNTSSGVTAIRAMGRLLKAGKTVSVFPEGTTFPDDEVRPFHKGAFVAAKMSGAPIVPVGIAYERSSSAAFVQETFVAHLSRMAATRQTRVGVVVGEPIRAEKSAEQTAALARERVGALVLEARRLIE